MYANFRSTANNMQLTFSWFSLEYKELTKY